MYSLDSDTLNGIFKGHPQIVQRFRTMKQSDLRVCTIVIEEIGREANQSYQLVAVKEKAGWRRVSVLSGTYGKPVALLDPTVHRRGGRPFPIMAE